MVAEKNFNAPKHPELEAVPNLQVIKALTSLKSRGYVKEQFAWRHFYWSLTNEGIQYLRDFLHLPPEIVPATLKRQAQRETRPRGSAGPRAGAGGVAKEADREAYRKAGDDGEGPADRHPSLPEGGEGGVHPWAPGGDEEGDCGERD